MAMKVSTPRFIHTPEKVVWIAAAMLDFPERGVPFRTTIRPGAASASPIASGYPEGAARETGGLLTDMVAWRDSGPALAAAVRGAARRRGTVRAGYPPPASGAIAPRRCPPGVAPGRAFPVAKPMPRWHPQYRRPGGG